MKKIGDPSHDICSKFFSFYFSTWGILARFFLGVAFLFNFFVELEFELETDSLVASNLEDFSSMGKI
jgi:hypothetical protein